MEFNMQITSEFQKVSACVSSLQIASAIFNEKDKRRAQVCIEFRGPWSKD